MVFVDATGAVVGPALPAFNTYKVAGGITVVGDAAAAYFDGSGYIWSGATLGVSGSVSGAWYQPQGIGGSNSDITGGGSVTIGQPYYQSNGGCHIAFYAVPKEPRLAFGYFDGTNWLFAAVKDAGVTTAVPSGSLYIDAGCSNLAGGFPPSDAGGGWAWVVPGSPSVAWNLTVPGVSFTQPFHREWH